MTEWRELLWTNILNFSNNFFLMTESEKKWWVWGAGMGEVTAEEGNSLFASRYAGKDRWWQLLEQSALTSPFPAAARGEKVTQRLLGVAVLDYASL